MTPEEVRATGRLAGHAAAGIARHARQVHRAAARRVFRPLGPLGAPVEVVHDAIADASYGAVGTSLRVAGLAAGAAVGVAMASAAPTSVPLGASRVGGFAQTVLNGVMGDDLSTRRDPLAIRMAVRVGGRDVPPTPGALAAAFPDATAHLVVFVHGFFEDDASWQGVFGERLRHDLGSTALHLRYNSGRPIADNGAELSALLDSLVEAWPVPPERLALVGHSMGGVVVRSACRVGADAGAAWVPLLSDVVSIAAPHRGAPLARLAGVAVRILRGFPDAAPWSSFIVRSAGVRDLEAGPDIAGITTARHHVVWSSLDGIAGLLLGDLFVHPASAYGCDHLDAAPLAGLHHVALLTHPAVYDALRAWLDGQHLR